MHLKKFIFLYLTILCLGLLFLSAKDLIFISSAESQVARVDHHEPGPVETYYKLGSSYQTKTLAPAIAYAVDGKEYIYTANYSCEDGCNKVGSEITIFYKKDEPTKVLVSSFGDMWKFKIYFLIMMGVLLVTALPYLYYHVNKQPES